MEFPGKTRESLAQYIWRYVLYSSRTRGIWERYDYIIRLAPHGWKEKKNQEYRQDDPLPEEPEVSMDKRQERSTWARLIKKVLSYCRFALSAS